MRHPSRFLSPQTNRKNLSLTLSARSSLSLHHSRVSSPCFLEPDLRSTYNHMGAFPHGPTLLYSACAGSYKYKAQVPYLQTFIQCFIETDSSLLAFEPPFLP